LLRLGLESCIIFTSLPQYRVLSKRLFSVIAKRSAARGLAKPAYYVVQAGNFLSTSSQRIEKASTTLEIIIFDDAKKFFSHISKIRLSFTRC
jgi:hypothetical protein